MFSGSSYTIEFDHAGQEKFDLNYQQKDYKLLFEQLSQ